MKLLFAILFLIVGLVAVPVPVVAGDLITARAVLEDRAGTLMIADVAGREFKPIGSTLSKGFINSAIWLRLQVRAPAKGNQAVLFIRQPFLNEIRLYEAAAGNPPVWKTRYANMSSRCLMSSMHLTTAL